MLIDAEWLLDTRLAGLPRVPQSYHGAYEKSGTWPRQVRSKCTKQPGAEEQA